MKFIEGIHIYKSKSGEIKIRQSKKYVWIISKELEKENISPGDLVLVYCKNMKAPVIVLKVFESKEEKTKYKKVIKILDRVKRYKFNVT